MVCECDVNQERRFRGGKEIKIKDNQLKYLRDKSSTENFFVFDLKIWQPKLFQSTCLCFVFTIDSKQQSQEIFSRFSTILYSKTIISSISMTFNGYIWCSAGARRATTFCGPAANAEWRWSHGWRCACSQDSQTDEIACIRGACGGRVNAWLGT